MNPSSSPLRRRRPWGARRRPGWRRWTRRGVRLQGDRLRPASDATTVRVRDGEVLIVDGPFAETKEQIAGFDILECADLDEAIEVAAKHPVARFGVHRGEAVLAGCDAGRSERRVAEAFREEWGRVVASLIRTTGDWDLAEECAQDAFAEALRALAARRRPAPARRLADHGGAQPGPRPAAPQRDRERPSCRRWPCCRPGRSDRARAGDERRRRHPRTTGCG